MHGLFFSAELNYFPEDLCGSSQVEFPILSRSLDFLDFVRCRHKERTANLFNENGKIFRQAKLVKRTNELLSIPNLIELEF